MKVNAANGTETFTVQGVTFRSYGPFKWEGTKQGSDGRILLQRIDSESGRYCWHCRPKEGEHETYQSGNAPHRQAAISAALQHWRSTECRGCGDLGRVTNGMSPDRPCPVCKPQWKQRLYRFKVWLWERGFLRTREDFR